jgi:hypothetical protein
MITCNDSDGLNYYIKGAAVNSSGGYYPDYCSSSTNIVEYICSPKFGISESRFTCPYICSNGTCQSQPSTCTDSDGGFNYYTKGNISGYLANESRNYVYNDYCAGGPNNTYLSETYCNGTNPLSLIYVCPYGCSNSVCVQPTAPAISSTINQIKTTQNNLGYKNVIGSSAVQDNIAAIDLAGFLKINNTLTASDIGTPITIPAIVIGGPCVNQKAAVLLNLSYPSCEYNSTIPQNHGIIRTFNNNNKTQILVAGWNAIDTRIAARAVVRYLEFYSKLNTSNATTYGNNLENVTVN